MHKLIISSILSVELFFLVGCPSVTQKIVYKVQYRKDLKFKINNSFFIGVAVPPIAEAYEIEIEAPFKLDLLKIETCHREISIQDAFYKKRILKKRNLYKFNFVPIEIEKDCIVEISALSKKEAHSFGFIALNSGFYNITATNTCNGTKKSSEGVSICQAKKGLIQQIKFKEKVIPQGNCPIMKINDFKFQYEIKKNHCVFLFTVKDLLRRKIHKLHTYGYEKIILRNI